MDVPELEPYFTVKQVAEAFQVSEQTVRAWFRNDPTVLTWGNPETRFKKAYINIRIPRSTIERMKRSGKPPEFCT